MSAEDAEQTSELATPIEISCPDDFEHDISLAEAQKRDLVLANGVVATVHCMWSQVKSLAAVIKMAETTFKVIEQRRNVLGLPYGYQPEKTKTIDPNSSQFFSPIK